MQVTKEIVRGIFLVSRCTNAGVVNPSRPRMSLLKPLDGTDAPFSEIDGKRNLFSIVYI